MKYRIARFLVVNVGMALVTYALDRYFNKTKSPNETASEPEQPKLKAA